MPIFTESLTHAINFSHLILFSNSKVSPVYGSVDRANAYFSELLEADRWNSFDEAKKLKALVRATKIIEALNFVGEKTDTDQLLQFPRGTDTTAPNEIEYAAYEIALALLKGVNPDTERENLFKTSQDYGSIRTRNTRNSVPPWFIAGVPSAVAWDYLSVYLEPNLEVNIRKI